MILRLAVLPLLLSSPAFGTGLLAVQGAHASVSVPDHAVSGVVTAVDDRRLVIRRIRKTPFEMTFGVDASTVREGVIAVGARVQVRFRDGHPAVATAILAVRRS